MLCQEEVLQALTYRIWRFFMKKHVVACCVSALMITGYVYGEYLTMDDYTGMRKIDAHVHLRTADTLIPQFAASENFSFITINNDKNDWDHIEKEHQSSMDLIEAYPDVVAYIGAFSVDGWTEPGWSQRCIRHIERIRAKGVCGIKIWKNVGMDLKDTDGSYVLMDHPKFFPIYKYMADNDIPLLVHVGDSKNCWLPLEEMTVQFYRDVFSQWQEHYMYLYPDRPSYESHMEARDNVLAKFPKLRMIGAHLGCLDYSLDAMSEHLEKYPNFYFDIAARSCDLENFSRVARDATRDFMIKYQDRLLYGTDVIVNPESDDADVQHYLHGKWRKDWQFFVTDDEMEEGCAGGKFRGLKLPGEVVEKLYYRNAMRLYGLK